MAAMFLLRAATVMGFRFVDLHSVDPRSIFHVRFTPESDIKSDIWECPLWNKLANTTATPFRLFSTARPADPGK